VHSISGALSGVTGISGTQGPLLPTAGVVGTSDTQAGVSGTSNAQAGVFGYSNNVGVVGQTTNPNSFAGFFVGNVAVNGTLTAQVTLTAPRTGTIANCLWLLILRSYAMLWRLKAVDRARYGFSARSTTRGRRRASLCGSLRPSTSV
jgi:hypothetical protein